MHSFEKAAFIKYTTASVTVGRGPHASSHADLIIASMYTLAAGNLCRSSASELVMLQVRHQSGCLAMAC